MTSSTLKPIKVWGQGGPNPPKVAMVLEELGIPYEIEPLPISEVKSPKYLAINPNGRLPAIQDPNTGITLWESGAIVEYLIETYDKEYKLSFPAGTTEYFHAKQWLFFQTTGQGPYFGQAAWFTKFHHEQIPSAKERYNKELNRITGVLESVLARHEKEYSHSAGFDGPWLVGNKFSFADLVFVSWQKIIAFIVLEDQYDINNYPHVKAWMDKMLARDTIKGVIDRSVAVSRAEQSRKQDS